MNPNDAQFTRHNRRTIQPSTTLLWPKKTPRVHLLNLTTGQVGEKWIVAPLLMVTGIALCLYQTGLITVTLHTDWSNQGWIEWLKHLYS